jgi:hypothetical protein
MLVSPSSKTTATPGVLCMGVALSRVVALTVVVMDCPASCRLQGAVRAILWDPQGMRARPACHTAVRFASVTGPMVTVQKPPTTRAKRY